MPLSNAEELATLNFYNGKVSHGLTVPTTVYYGLHLGPTPPDKDAGTGANEPTEANYVRQSATLGTLWNAATGGDPTTANNASAISWPATGAAYSDDVYYVLEFTSLIATTFRRAFKLTTPATIGSGDQAQISAAALVAEFGDENDSFGETS